MKLNILLKELLKISNCKKVLIILSLGIGIFISWFVYEIYTNEPPMFFPLDDVQAQYTVTKNCPGAQGWVEQSQVVGNAYCLEYKGNNVFLNNNYPDSKFFSITIGITNINLEEYIDKRVKNIKGKFTTSNKQCVQSKCVDIGGPYVVLNIDSLKRAD